MINFLKLIGKIFLGCVPFVILILIFMCFPEIKYHYEFIDLDDNSGVAKECSYKFDGYRRGGQGSPVCELEDGTIKQVKEYKYIYDGEYVQIKEIFNFGWIKWIKRCSY